LNRKDPGKDKDINPKKMKRERSETELTGTDSVDKKVGKAEQKTTPAKRPRLDRSSLKVQTLFILQFVFAER
jgi:hypothetical protein